MTNAILTGNDSLPPNFNLVHSQTTTLERILVERPKIEDPLGLLTATVDVSVFESEEALFYRVYFPGTLLLGQDFIKLLTSARPAESVSKFGVQRILGTYSDWDLPNRVDDKSKELAAMHQRLFDPHWSELLSYHGAPFKDAVSNGNYSLLILGYGFTPGNYDKALVPLVLWRKDKNSGQRTYLSSEVPQALMEDVDRRSNTLAGLLAFVSLSPKQRDQLPSELMGRPMLEGQIPLVALLPKYIGLLLTAPLFPKVEALY